uniref:Uncharacterized protein n=1 Tax=Anguilla anguilla TaxID=7936 RepID=A0A0E9QHC4_ANGAN
MSICKMNMNVWYMVPYCDL